MRAVGYIRVSSTKESQSQSIENQKKLIANYMKDHGYTLCDFYIDIQTGRTGNRDSLKRLIEDAKIKKFDLIICKELSRLARNSGLASDLRKLFLDSNIDLVTLDNAIDTLKNKRDYFGLYAWLYEIESKHTSDRIKRTFITKYRNGEFLGNAPYGYKKNNNKLVIDEDIATIVKDIFAMFKSGWGYDRIARYLSKKKVPTPAQTKGKINAGEYWHGSTISAILRNEAYIGNTVQHKETTVDIISNKRRKIPQSELIRVNNTHPNIISSEDFEIVQKIIKSKNSKGRGKVKAQTNFFTNYLFCADCGAGMWHRHKINTYVCGKYGRHGKIACTRHSVKEEALKKLILDDLKEMAKSFDEKNIIAKYKKKTDKIKRESKKELLKIEKRIKVLMHQQEACLDNLLDETITKKIYTNKTSKIEAELESLDEKMKNLDKSSSTDDLSEFQVFKDNLDEILKLDELTEEMLSILVDRIEIQENGIAKIFYKFAIPTLD